MNKDSSPPWNPILEREPHAAILPRGSDRVLGKSRGQPFALACDRALLDRVLACLTGPTSAARLAERLAVSWAELESYVNTLIEAGLLRVAGNPPSPGRPAYIDAVLLMGDDFLADELQRGLELARLGLSLRRVTGDPAQAFGADGQPLILGVPKAATTETLIRLNDRCLAAGVPWLPAYFDGAWLRVGPLVLPHKTPCFRCLLERQAFDQRLLHVDFPPAAAFYGIQESWPLSRPGVGGQASAVALACLRGVPYCVHDIAALAEGKRLPALIGCQVLIATDDPAPAEPGRLVFEANSACPSCHGGAHTPASPWQAGVQARPVLSLNLDSGPVRQTDGGLRSVDGQEARRIVDAAFAPFGLTFRIERCGYGPLGHLPSYRAVSTGYLDRDLPFIIPEKVCTGKGITEQQAYLSAAYEMAERVSAAYHGRQALIRARISEAGEAAIDLGQALGVRYLHLAGYDRPEDDGLVDWVWGTSLFSGESRLVPASMVFFPQQRFLGTFKSQWSGGLAAGARLADAILQGLLERVEHDGWAIWQLNRLGGPRLDPASIADEEAQAWLAAVRAAGFMPIIRDRRTELGIPSFRAWLVSSHTPQAYACRGDGAHPDPLIALKRALTEAQHKLAFAQPDAWPQVLVRPSTQLLEEVRSLYFLSGLAPYEFATDGAVIDFASIPNWSHNDVHLDIQTVLDRLMTTGAGRDVVVVDLTDVHLAIPVVRVLAIGLQEMAKPWTYILPRTLDLPVRLGWRSRQLAYEELYHGPFPH